MFDFHQKTRITFKTIEHHTFLLGHSVVIFRVTPSRKLVFYLLKNI